MHADIRIFPIRRLQLVCCSLLDAGSRRRLGKYARSVLERQSLATAALPIGDPDLIAWLRERAQSDAGTPGLRGDGYRLMADDKLLCLTVGEVTTPAAAVVNCRNQVSVIKADRVYSQASCCRRPVFPPSRRPATTIRRFRSFKSIWPLEPSSKVQILQVRSILVEIMLYSLLRDDRRPVVGSALWLCLHQLIKGPFQLNDCRIVD